MSVRLSVQFLAPHAAAYFHSSTRSRLSFSFFLLFSLPDAYLALNGFKVGIVCQLESQSVSRLVYLYI